MTYPTDNQIWTDNNHFSGELIFSPILPETDKWLLERGYTHYTIVRCTDNKWKAAYILHKDTGWECGAN